LITLDATRMDTDPAARAEFRLALEFGTDRGAVRANLATFDEEGPGPEAGLPSAPDAGHPRSGGSGSGAGAGGRTDEILAVVGWV